MSAPESAMIGQTISHYKILEKIGGGGMGIVYKAEDTKLKRTVALKFLPPELIRDPEAKKRFIQEARAASALDHNNICTVHEIDETADGRIFIVMAYYEGRTLADAISNVEAIGRSPLSFAEAIDITSQICEGLSKAHEGNIVHRDLKPANVMITKDGVVKIVDFGLAKLGDQKLTQLGTTLGTVSYMSPEQSRGEEVDHRTDIFSLGVLLYEMLTGQLPFKGDYEQAVIYSILHEEPEPISAIRPEIPAEFETIVDHCLKKERSDRYQNVEELLKDLKRLTTILTGFETRSGLTTAPAKPTVNRLKVVLPIIAASLFFAVALGYVFRDRESAATERIPIAVVDFVNQTSEPELDGLSGMLITALEQSRRLNVFSRARMYDEFKLMNRPDLTFVDENAGREISKRANIAALAVATIRNFDDLYTIDFKVIDPRTGDRLFSTKVEGDGKKSIPGMLDQLSEKTHIDLKEQEEVVQLASRGVAGVTTTNLEAYQHYFLGEQLMSQIRDKEAQEEYRKAIALDSTFGLAYYRLANAVAWNLARSLPKNRYAKLSS